MRTKAGLGIGVGLSALIAFIAVGVLKADGQDDRQLLLGMLVLVYLLTAVLAFYVVKIIERDKEAVRLREEDERRSLLLSELHHRVKNNISVVQSLAVNTKRVEMAKIAGDKSRADTLNDFYRAFEDRLQALSAAHSLLMLSADNVPLHRILEATLSPLTDLSRVNIEGPRVILTANTAVMTNLLFHELATNAIKYGALSVPEGRIDLHWEQRGDFICFTWREIGGPPVRQPTSTGFGSKLIETTVIRDLGGKSEMVFEESGLVCKIEMPISDRVRLESDDTPEAEKAT